VIEQLRCVATQAPELVACALIAAFDVEFRRRRKWSCWPTRTGERGCRVGGPVSRNRDPRSCQSRSRTRSTAKPPPGFFLSS
jgi:hypothetical protein